MESVEKGNLPVVCATCCAYNLLYCEWPWCIGCVGLSECLCIGFEGCLKCDAEPITCCIDDKNQEHKLCQLGLYCCGVYLKQPTTLVKVSSQLLCCVNQMALPCDSTVPCMFTVLCLTLYPRCGCCVKFGEMERLGTCGHCVPPPRKY
jgi:hypothetical protein